jgi:hypothetical protein
MKDNKLFKHILIIIFISLVLFFLYNSITPTHETFEVVKGITTELQNITIGEPKLITDNLNKIININIENNTYQVGDTFKSKLELLCSNNLGFYGKKNNSDSNIYYYTKGNTEFQPLSFALNIPTPTNPDYKNQNNCGAHLLNVTNKTLWYYNNVLNDMQNINIDCIYYAELDALGKPKQNTSNKINFYCLRLPSLSSVSLPTTQPQVTDSLTIPDAPYDKIRLIAANDNILFAVGCHALQIQTIYYCKLINGKPASNESLNWKTKQIGNISDINNILDIIINDNFVFLITKQYKLYYNKIEFDSTGLLISNFKEIILPVAELTFYSPKFCVNNTIFFIYDINTNIRINIKWFNITKLEQNTNVEVKNILFDSAELYTIPNDLMIYKNFLIGENGANYFSLELYDDTITNNEIEINKNTIHKMFNPNYDPTATTTTKASTSSNNNTTTTKASTSSNNNTTTTKASTSSNNTTTTKASTSGTALPNPTAQPLGNQAVGSFVFGSALSAGSLLNNEIENISNSADGIPINDINFEELSGVNMLINGKYNTRNFNDFMAKNRVFGNNLFFINKN